MLSPLNSTFAFFLALTLLHTTLAAPLYWRWRWKWPIRGDAQLIVLVAAVSQTVEGSWTLLSTVLQGDLPCIGIFIFKSIPLFLACNCLLARAWRVWFLYYRAAERIKMARTHPSRLGVDTDAPFQGGAETEAEASVFGKFLLVNADSLKAIAPVHVSGTAALASWRSKGQHSRSTAPVLELGAGMYTESSTPASELGDRKSHILSDGAHMTRGESLASVSKNVVSFTGEESDKSSSAKTGKPAISKDHHDSAASRDSVNSPLPAASVGPSKNSPRSAASVDHQDLATSRDSSHSLASEHSPLSAASVDHQDAAASVDSARSTRGSHWFERNQKYFSQKFLLTVAVTLSVIEWSIPVILFFAIGDTSLGNTTDWDPKVGALKNWDNEFCVSLNLVEWTIYGVIGICALFTIYTCWHLRKAHDGFYIKRELFVDVCIGFCGIVIVSTRPWWQHIRPIWISWFFVSNGVIFMLLTWRVIQAARFERILAAERDSSKDDPQSDAPPALQIDVITPKSQTGNRKPAVSALDIQAKARANELTLSDVLSNREFRLKFVEHLTREFSVENYMFYRAADYFSRLCRQGKLSSKEERNSHAATIFATYIDEGAPAQVNLSAQVSIPIGVAFSKALPSFDAKNFRQTQDFKPSEDDSCIPHDIFAQAQKRVLQLMERDTFVRFKKDARLQADM